MKAPFVCNLNFCFYSNFFSTKFWKNYASKVNLFCFKTSSLQKTFYCHLLPSFLFPFNSQNDSKIVHQTSSKTKQMIMPFTLWTAALPRPLILKSNCSSRQTCEQIINFRVATRDKSDVIYITLILSCLLFFLFCVFFCVQLNVMF